MWPRTQEHEDLLGVSNGVAAPAAAIVAAPAAAVDEGSSLLSQYEQQEAFAADPTANGNASGRAVQSPHETFPTITSPADCTGGH